MKNLSSSYGIGGNEVKFDGNEGITEIPQNKTLVVQKLTPNTPVKPEVVKGMKNMDDVFNHFNPSVSINFEAEEGNTVREELNFRNVGDFTVKGLTSQSSTLSDLQIKSEQYQKMIKQLKTNKVLKLALQDPEAKKSVIESIETLIQEIENSEN